MLLLGHLGHMIGVGIPIARALDALRVQMGEGGPVAERLLQDVLRGRALSEAMSHVPGAFSALQIGVVRAAELSGDLPRALQRLTGHEARDLDIARRVRAALLYPATVFGCAVAFVLLVSRYLVSGMLPLLTSPDVRLSLAGRVVVAVAVVMERPWVWIVGLLLVGGGLWAARRFVDRASWEALLDRLPVFGALLRDVAAARACESLAMLQAAGIPVVQALERAAEASGNVAASRALRSAAAGVVHGSTLAAALDRAGFFSRTVVHMVAVGEESGRLPLLLDRVRAYNELRVRTLLDGLSAALEPIMITALGVLVGVIVLVAFAPIYQMVAALQ